MHYVPMPTTQHPLPDTHNITPSTAAAYLLQTPQRYLPQLSALYYDKPIALHGVVRGSGLAALAMIGSQFAGTGNPHPQVLLAADDLEALAQLLALGGWPVGATWCGSNHEQALFVAHWLGHQAQPSASQHYYLAENAPTRLQPQVRRLTPDDATMLDLTPCNLSTAALHHWMLVGWRVFGAIEAGQLICHALAGYPLPGFEEVAAVFTAPAARQRGLASAVVAATIGDIVGRGNHAYYVSAAHNLGSQRVATGLGLRFALETWCLRAAEQ